MTVSGMRSVLYPRPEPCLRFSPAQHARLVFKHAANCLLAEIPQFGNFGN
jgi:hypothetical protein